MFVFKDLKMKTHKREHFARFGTIDDNSLT